MLAGPPPTMPLWLGWLIGLVPVWAILGYIGWRAWASARVRRHIPATR
ncbi:MAG TPA: hypothetical protein VFZ66_24665 [Herpetosiphonaceae bacterium]